MLNFAKLKDPNGFKIFNKTSYAPLDSGFISQHFDLPKYLRSGRWQVKAFATSGKAFEVSFLVRDYGRFYYSLGLISIYLRSAQIPSPSENWRNFCP
jgi:hypothetical protein